jgi:hypothetical protein
MNTQPLPAPTMSPDDMIMEWHASKGMLTELKDREMNLRKQLIKGMFDLEKEGTQNHALGNGYVLKGVVKKVYKLDTDEDKHTEALSQLDDNTAANLVEWTPSFDKELYEALTWEEQQIVNKAIGKWTPSLNKKEYQGLDDEDMRVMSKAVVSSFAAPTLTLIEPKAKDVIPTLVK